MKKIIIAFVVFLFVANGLFSKIDQVVVSYDTSSMVLQKQSLLQYASLLCMAPVKIIDKLIGENSLQDKKSPTGTDSNKNNRDHNNSSLEYLASGNIIPTVSSCFETGNANNFKDCLNSGFSLIKHTIKTVHHPPGGFTEVIILLMCFLTLPRSDIPDGMVKLRTGII